MKKYVINLITSGRRNDYGYWAGKSYVFQGDRFPVHTDHIITSNTKVFNSKVRAESSAQKCYKRYSYVSKAVVEEVEV